MATPLIGLTCLTGIVTILLALALIQGKDRLGIFDMPNSRSSHDQPKPRTGGIAIFLAWIIGTLLLKALGLNLAREESVLFWMMMGATGFFVIGLLEDVYHLSEWLRLVMELAWSGFLSWGGPHLQSLEMFGSQWTLPQGVGVAITAVWYTGFMNFFNFMDGVDAIAAGEAIVAGGFMWWWTGYAGILLASAAALGFLIYNRPPSKIFMGDGGSYFLGYVLAATAVAGSREGGGTIPFVAYVILLSTFIWDPLATLGRRIWQGDPWFKAHRSHYYQKATNVGFSHGQVSWLNASFTSGLGCLAWGYGQGSGRAQVIIVGGWLIIFIGIFICLHRLELIYKKKAG